jgi:hypothetical protein
LVSLMLWTRRLDPSVVDLVERLSKRGPIYAPSWLIAAAMREGRYAWAARLPRSDDYLSSWMLAKLALRNGDIDDAAVSLDKAWRQAPDDDRTSCEHNNNVYNPSHRIAVERAIVALQQQQPDDAMRWLWHAASDDFVDVAYVAEQVLTTAQLQAFVDSRSLDDRLSDDGRTLRALLGRRLFREHKYDEALPYMTEHIFMAQEFRDAMTRASTSTDALTRATALLDAHRLLNTPDVGRRLLGTEGPPDWAIYDGSYAEEWPRDGHATLALSDLRYHYRYVAAELAEQAANLVHPRSQAYAALLCHAADGLIDLDSALADRIYRTYLRNGAYMEEPPWTSFGRNCGTPDIERLRDPAWQKKTLAVRQHEAHAAKWLWRKRMLFAAALTVVIAAAVAATSRVLLAALTRRR